MTLENLKLHMRLTVLLYGKALIYKICWSPFSLLVRPHFHLLSLSLILLETSAFVLAVFSCLEWPSLTNQTWLVSSAPAGLSWWFYLQSHLFSPQFLFFLPSQSFSLVLKTFLWLSCKESTCNTGDTGDPGLIPGSASGEGNDNPLQYSCLGNPMDRGAWQATVHGIAKS